MGYTLVEKILMTHTKDELKEEVVLQLILINA